MVIYTGQKPGKVKRKKQSSILTRSRPSTWIHIKSWCRIWFLLALYAADLKFCIGHLYSQRKCPSSELRASSDVCYRFVLLEDIWFPHAFCCRCWTHFCSFNSEPFLRLLSEAVQRSAVIAEAEGTTTIEPTHLERVLPQLLLDFWCEPPNPSPHHRPRRWQWHNGPS